MTTTILVTGATGTTGSTVVERLAQCQGVEVRAGVRSPSAALEGATPFDFEKPDVVAAAPVSFREYATAQWSQS
jgi:uncharacterized protein YbjT (DUF2867 family)